jgi:hypothetical protein
VPVDDVNLNVARIEAALEPVRDDRAARPGPENHDSSCSPARSHRDRVAFAIEASLDLLVKFDPRLDRPA